MTGSRCYFLFTYQGTDWSIKISKYFWPKKFSNRYVEHGIEQETYARQTYENLFKKKVLKLGFVICPMHPWLRYSADGIIFGNSILKLFLYYYYYYILYFYIIFIGKQRTVLDILKDCKYLT